MQRMTVLKLTDIFTQYGVTEPVEEFICESETYVFAGRRWFSIYLYHLPSSRQSSTSIVPYRDKDVEYTISELVYQAIPRDEQAYLDRFQAYFSEVIEPPEE